MKPIVLLAIPTVAVWVVLVQVVGEAADLTGVGSLLLAVWLLFDRTAQAVRDFPAAVRDVRAWWRRRRAIATYQVGSGPVRPDTVANQAA